MPPGTPAATSAPLGHSRLCREVSTERNLLSVAGTFFELPAANAGGFARIHPVSTHNRRIHDYASNRGLLVISGVLPGAPAGGHIIRSTDNQCALWAGTVDDLWAFGKPRGLGGPWHDTAVEAGVPSDPCLATGYDRKTLTVSHRTGHALTIRVEADFTGDGTSAAFTTLTVPAAAPTVCEFPADFGAYWLRLVSSEAATVTAQFRYE